MPIWRLQNQKLKLIVLANRLHNPLLNDATVEGVLLIIFQSPDHILQSLFVSELSKLVLDSSQSVQKDEKLTVSFGLELLQA
jgi:hypothetical protein